MIDSEKYGPWVVITGASSGIGEQYAYLLAAEGFNLILIARRKTLLHSIKNTIQQKHNVEIRVCEVDLSSLVELDTLLEEIRQYDIGLLVSNAGFGLKGEFLDHDVTQLQQMVQLNAVTPMLLAHSLLGQMKKRGSGGIIFTGSIEGEAPFPYSSTYAASKAFLHSLGNSLWYECRQYGIDVVVLSPGSTDTDAPINQGISRDQLLGVMPPERVAREAIEALGKKAIVMPGLHNRLFIGLLRCLPRRIASLLAGKGMLQAINNSKS